MGRPGDPYLGHRAPARLGPDFQLDSLADVGAFRSISRRAGGGVYIDVIYHVTPALPLYGACAD